MDYRYKIGELVRVRDDLKFGAFYRMLSGPCAGDLNIATASMAELHGQLVHISDHSSGGQYLVEETGGCRWVDDMFECSESNDECHCESLL